MQRATSNEQVNTKVLEYMANAIQSDRLHQELLRIGNCFFLLAVVGSLLEPAAEQGSHFSNSPALFCRMQFVPTR